MPSRRREDLAALDDATRIGASPALLGRMMGWLEVGAGIPGPRQYALSLDVTCEVPTADMAPGR